MYRSYVDARRAFALRLMIAVAIAALFIGLVVYYILTAPGSSLK